MDVSEARELIGNFVAVDHVENALKIKGWTLRAAKVNAFTEEFGAKVLEANIDTETPVMVMGTTKFFAFVEA